MIIDDIKAMIEPCRLENLACLGDGEWQALISDPATDRILRGTGDSIEMALTMALEGECVGTLFATSYVGDRSKPAQTRIDLSALGVRALGAPSKKLIVARRV